MKGNGTVLFRNITVESAVPEESRPTGNGKARVVLALSAEPPKDWSTLFATCAGGVEAVYARNVEIRGNGLAFESPVQHVGEAVKQIKFVVQLANARYREVHAKEIADQKAIYDQLYEHHLVDAEVFPEG